MLFFLSGSFDLVLYFRAILNVKAEKCEGSKTVGIMLRFVHRVFCLNVQTYYIKLVNVVIIGMYLHIIEITD